MAPIAQEPQSGNDYDDRTTQAVKSVLLEIAQILGSFKDKFTVIGGAVPWLLLDNPEMRHVGTLDVDLGLDAEALGEGEYVTLVEALMGNGYEQRETMKRFQLVRRVPVTDGGPAIDVIVDFLMPRDAKIVKNNPPIIDEFAVQRASGADLALRFKEMLKIDGVMPGGGKNRVEIGVASIPALLVMKGFAINNRLKAKDAYDIYYSIRNYPGGPEALAAECRPLLTDKTAAEGYGYIAEKFADPDGFGPTNVRKFVEDSPLVGELTLDQWQRDAFGQVDAWVRALGIRV